MPFNQEDMQEGNLRDYLEFARLTTMDILEEKHALNFYAKQESLSYKSLIWKIPWLQYGVFCFFNLHLLFIYNCIMFR